MGKESGTTILNGKFGDNSSERGKNDNNGTKDATPGGLQIKHKDTVEERPSKFRVGGITNALLEIPEDVTQKLTPKTVIHKDEPVYPTESRISRLRQKAKKKDKLGGRLKRTAAKYDLWAIQNVPHASVIAFQLCIALAPMLFILTVWDLLGVAVLRIPHLTTLNRPGLLYPFYPIGTVASFYGYMMRFLMEDVSRKTYICLAGVFVYPGLLVMRCIIHFFFNGYRDERKLWY